ncbi:MAG: hypothetical protein ACPGD5_07200, partial [Salibacteraceae bacterium]
MKYWYITCIWFIAIIPNTNAQTNSKLDSLEQLLPQSQGEEKMTLLAELSWGYFYEDREKSAYYSAQEIELAKTLNNDSIVVIAYNDHGRSLYGQSQFDSAIYFYKLAIPIGKQR